MFMVFVATAIDACQSILAIFLLLLEKFYVRLKLMKEIYFVFFHFIFIICMRTSAKSNFFRCSLHYVCPCVRVHVYIQGFQLMCRRRNIFAVTSHSLKFHSVFTWNVKASITSSTYSCRPLYSHLSLLSLSRCSRDVRSALG